MSDNTSERLKQIFERFVTNSVELEAVSRGEPFLATLSIDSLTLVHMISEIEKEFSVRFDVETLDGAFVDFPTLLAFLAEQQGA
jgi:acyl carrier protein